MTEKRRYRLLCPIARALDVVGDRWALLILRDLHAGPARFQELEAGLGIATNLLSTRLVELADAGLVERSPDSRRGAYQLTDLGRGTDRLLWELSGFGSQLGPDPDPREPGNLRTIALPLRMALQGVTDRPDLTARLHVDDDTFTIVSTPSTIEVLYNDVGREPDVTVGTSYECLLDVSEGRIPLEQFVDQHLNVLDGNAHVAAFLSLMGTAMAGPR